MKVFSQVAAGGTGGGGGAHARWREESPVELSSVETCQLYLGSLPDHLSLSLSPHHVNTVTVTRPNSDLSTTDYQGKAFLWPDSTNTEKYKHRAGGCL